MDTGRDRITREGVSAAGTWDSTSAPFSLREFVGVPESVTAMLIKAAVFSVAFFLAYEYSMSFHHSGSAPLWLPDAILLSALLLNSPRTWWIYILIPLPFRFFIGTTPDDSPWWFLLSAYLNDTLKAVIGAAILRRLSHGRPELATVREYLQFLLVAVLAMPALSAFAGAAARYAAYGDDYWTAWQSWFLGDSLANVILTPAIIFWGIQGTSAVYAHRSRMIEAALLFGTLIVVSGTILSGQFGDSPILIFLPMPLLLYTVMRFGPLAVTSANLIVTAFAVWYADQGLGPFAGGGLGASMLWLQLFYYVRSILLVTTAVLLSERKRTMEELALSHAWSQALAAKLLTSHEDERRRIFGELHDGLGQTLALIQLQAAQCQRDIDQPDKVLHEVKNISATLQTAFTELRAIVSNLRPSELDHLGLAGSIRSMIRKLSLTTDVKLSGSVESVEGLLSPDAETGIYRIIQEALNNVLKHSQATSAWVSLSFNGHDLLVEVEDDGIGLERPKLENEHGFGLAGIKERARILGATVRFDSRPGKGTRVSFRLPMKNNGTGQL